MGRVLIRPTLSTTTTTTSWWNDAPGTKIAFTLARHEVRALLWFCAATHSNYVLKTSWEERRERRVKRQHTNARTHTHPQSRPGWSNCRCIAREIVQFGFHPPPPPSPSLPSSLPGICYILRPARLCVCVWAFCFTPFVTFRTTRRRRRRRLWGLFLLPFLLFLLLLFFLVSSVCR